MTYHPPKDHGHLWVMVYLMCGLQRTSRPLRSSSRSDGAAAAGAPAPRSRSAWRPPGLRAGPRLCERVACAFHLMCCSAGPWRQARGDLLVCTGGHWMDSFVMA